MGCGRDIGTKFVQIQDFSIGLHMRLPMRLKLLFAHMVIRLHGCSIQRICLSRRLQCHCLMPRYCNHLSYRATSASYLASYLAGGPSSPQRPRPCSSSLPVSGDGRNRCRSIESRRSGLIAQQRTSEFVRDHGPPRSGADHP